MLGKIMKHEVKATWRYFCAIDAATLIIGFVAGIVGFMVTGNIDNLPTALTILLFLSLAGFVFAMVSAVILTTIYNVVHYYRSLYTAEGYLTFTLPATTAEILSAKILVALVWQIVLTLCVAVSVFTLIGSFMLYEALHGALNMQEFFYDFWYGFSDLFGMEGILELIPYVLSIVLQIVLNLMMFFFAISIGQLWQRHKVLGSIIAYFATRFILGIVTFITSIATGSFGILFSEADDPGRYFSNNMISSLLISLVVSVGMYFACIYITDKKLNLD